MDGPACPVMDDSPPCDSTSNPGATGSSSVRSTRLRCGPRGRGVVALLQALRFPFSLTLLLRSDLGPSSVVLAAYGPGAARVVKGPLRFLLLARGRAALPSCCRAPGSPLLAIPALQVPGARSYSQAPDGVRAARGAPWHVSPPSRSRSNSWLKGRVWPAGSQGHLCTYLRSSSLLGCRDTGPRAPASNTAFVAAAPFHLRGAPRVRSQHFRFIKPHLLRFESRGSGMPPPLTAN
ncbi:hypothetical protein NDU88_001785 [Pleurodeles waltl]|uniref:Uncharacterized protein n=1 Tax=Pleurodeles waltl TaxID=8319 RepID=A0AAV7UUB3_PLEWA|nr:hypothetical protein NDU88_001785 [Pleurodeles waltl]